MAECAGESSVDRLSAEGRSEWLGFVDGGETLADWCIGERSLSWWFDAFVAVVVREDDEEDFVSALVELPACCSCNSLRRFSITSGTTASIRLRLSHVRSCPSWNEKIRSSSLIWMIEWSADRVDPLLRDSKIMRPKCLDSHSARCFPKTENQPCVIS